MGRPRRDLVQRCQASLWAKMVWEATGLDFDEMDFVFIPATGWNGTDPLPPNRLIKNELLRNRLWANHRFKVQQRRAAKKEADEAKKAGRPVSAETKKVKELPLSPRVMNRIYRSGDSPERVRGAQGGVSNLVEVFAAQDERCRFAREVYKHPIWDVLASQGPPTEERTDQLIVACLERLGLAILNDNVMYVADLVVGDAFPVKRDDLEQISAGASRLSSTGSLDAILPLALLCKLADEDLAYDIADVYVKALDKALVSFQDRVDDAYVVGTLREFIHDRLLRNEWKKTSPEDWLRSNLVRGVRRKKAEAYRLEAQQVANPAAFFFNRPETPSVHPHLPVIELDNKLTWFLRYHYVVLQSAIIVATGTNPYEESPADPQGEIDRVRRFWNAKPQPIQLFRSTLEEALTTVRSQRAHITSPSARLKRKKKQTG